jgi:hypothetical protein
MVAYLSVKGTPCDNAMSVLDLLIIAKTYVENQEGEVITFIDGQKAKIKNNHYIQLHGLIGPDAFRENLLIATILDGNIDDVIAQLVPGEKKNKLIAMEELVYHKFNSLVQEFIDLRDKYFNEFKEDRKEFAIKHSRKRLFGFVIRSINIPDEDVEKTARRAVREVIDDNTKALEKAKSWLDEIQV